MKRKTHRVELTRPEIVELLRALELICQEDEAADVNMEADSVAAKTSALAKLERASGLEGPSKRLQRMLKDAKSIDVKGDGR